MAKTEKVHGRGDARLDGVLDFVAFAARPMPLGTLLDEGPRRIAQIFGADVCSLYVLEGEGAELVMRGNVGFERAIGQVRLSVGEGITGRSVEYMRPISAEVAHNHASYKHFDGLGEERYPVFLAVPVRGRRGPLGALVLQRKERTFTEDDIGVVALMGGLLAAGISQAELLDVRRERSDRKAGGGTRKVTLPGSPFVSGKALGAIAALRRPAARPVEKNLDRQTLKLEHRRLRGAFDVAEKAIHGLAEKARRRELGDGARFLGTYLEILGDQRFRERALESISSDGGIPQALARVAREVTRTAASFTRDAFLEERARDVEDLCDAVTMLAVADKRAELPAKAILVGDQLTVFDLLVSARMQPSGVALSERAFGPRTKTLLTLLDVPAIVGVKGLFRWASDGDIALLDADHALLVINPTKSEIASMREHRREVEGKNLDPTEIPEREA